jgi:hypothetical protein
MNLKGHDKKRYDAGAVQGLLDIAKNDGQKTYHPYSALDCLWGLGYREAQDQYVNYDKVKNLNCCIDRARDELEEAYRTHAPQWEVNGIKGWLRTLEAKLEKMKGDK